MEELDKGEQSPPDVLSTEGIGSDLTITRRNLPHWQLGGSTYFVTFRVREGVTLAPEERAMVLQSCLYGHPEGVAGGGACPTNRNGGTATNGCSKAAQIGKAGAGKGSGERTGEGACPTCGDGGTAALACWENRKVGWRLHAAIVMPDHVHLLLTPAEVKSGGWVPLSKIMQGVKSVTSHRINKRRGRKGPLWQDESYDRVIRDEDEFNNKLKYICENAAKAGLAGDSFEYAFFWWEGSEE